MIDIVAVLRAEDAVLDFLSVLTAPEPRYRQDEAHEVHVLLGDIAEHLVLPAGLPPAERLAAVAPALETVCGGRAYLSKRQRRPPAATHRRLMESAMYDVCAGLGYHCESTYQPRRITGQDRAHFFDWLDLDLVAYGRSSRPTSPTCCAPA